MFRYRGFSLAELLIVTIILGIVTAVAIPVFSSNDNARLDYVAQEIAEAMIYARDRSIHTQTPHAITLDITSQTIEIHQIDHSTVPVTFVTVATHPVTKHDYRVKIGTGPYSKGLKLSNASDVFLLTNLARSQSIFFDLAGTPLWKDAAGSHGLLTGQVEVSSANGTKKVILYPMTGRVVIQ